ncbi:MAG TPA: hypothetical protein ENG42_00580 [Candidatus Aenigmarchaeota archaeon]|nr:MAG: hypothetical protein DRP03_00970 [Candidatus Aenigmarchaeota archaeon]HDD45947.1 hypothetical protein [Candidatus Aenigmarchaeota archaeon]
MGIIGKIIIGIILLVVGLFLYADSVGLFWTPVTGIDWLGNLIVIVSGSIPAFLILIGLFIVWLELDELKMEKELEEEELEKELKEIEEESEKETKKTQKKGRAKKRKKKK